MSEPVSADYLARQDTTVAHVLDSVFDGVYIADRDRRILFWNRGAEALTGYTRREVQGRRCADNVLCHINEGGHLLCRGAVCPLVQCMAKDCEISEKIYPLHKSGRRFPTLTHASPIRDGEGRIIAAIEVFRDISQDEDYRHLQEKFTRLVRMYMSENTFEELMALARSGDEAKARIRDLTLMYVDIAGFTTFSEKNTPEAVVAMLNEVFGICDVLTREHHGDVDKFIGDAMLATFVDANDAVAAASRIQHEAMPRYNEIREKEGQQPINLRIGINSGLVLQGDIGSDQRKDLTVIGDVVNCAERIQRACTPGEWLISESVYARLHASDASAYTAEADLSVKNREATVTVFRYFAR